MTETEIDAAKRLLAPMLHTSAPRGYSCADCLSDNIPCPDCYGAWWFNNHPGRQMPGSVYSHQKTPRVLLPNKVRKET